MVATVRPQAPIDPAVAVARSVAEGETAWRALRLHRLGIGEELVGGLGKLREAGLLRGFDAVVHQVAAVADRYRDPLVAALAVLHRAWHPASVFLAEIVGDVRHTDVFLRKQVRQRIET